MIKAPLRYWLGGLLLALASIAPQGAQAADYVRIHHEVVVARPAADVWKRIGDYCAIKVWMQVSCDYASGNGDVGTVRRLKDGTIVEAMVAKTGLSYTYWQTTGIMAATGYHGTLAVEPDGRNRSRITYTLFYDQAAMPSDAVRHSEHDRLSTRFLGLLGVMKELALKK
jgi:hypothetical protein